MAGVVGVALVSGPVGPTVVTLPPSAPCVVVATSVLRPPESRVATIATVAAITAIRNATSTGQIQSPG